MRNHEHFSWGHKRSLFFVGIQEVSVFRGYTRGLCFSWVYKRFLVFVGIQEVSVFRGDIRVSARRVLKELINHYLYLFA